MSATGASLGGLEDELEDAIERASEVMGRRDFLEQVGELVQESGGLLEPSVAALVVLDELGLAPGAEIVAPSYAKVLAPEDLEPALDGVIVEGELLGLEPTRTFRKRDGGMGFVTDARIRGDQGVYEITLWDEHIKGLVGVDPGTRVRLDGLYTKERSGQVELHTGRDARIQVLEDEPGEEPESEDASGAETEAT